MNAPSKPSSRRNGSGFCGPEITDSAFSTSAIARSSATAPSLSASVASRSAVAESAADAAVAWSRWRAASEARVLAAVPTAPRWVEM